MLELTFAKQLYKHFLRDKITVGSASLSAPPPPISDVAVSYVPDALESGRGKSEPFGGVLRLRRIAASQKREATTRRARI